MRAHLGLLRSVVKFVGAFVAFRRQIKLPEMQFPAWRRLAAGEVLRLVQRESCRSDM